MKADAVALKEDETTILYLPSEALANKTLKQFMLQYIDESDYEQYLERAKQEEQSLAPLSIDEQQLTDVSLTKNIEIEQALANPEEVLTTEKALKKLNLGVAHEQIYTVKEGDVLGLIANEHSLTTAELLSLNPPMTPESVIQIDQELKVIALKPVTEVLATEALARAHSLRVEILSLGSDRVSLCLGVLKWRGRIWLWISSGGCDCDTRLPGNAARSGVHRCCPATIRNTDIGRWSGNKIRVTALGDWTVIQQAGIAGCLVFEVMVNGG